MPGSPTVIDSSMPVTVPSETLGASPVPVELPRATMASPGSTLDESPSVTVASPDASSSWNSATSRVSSLPSTVAS